MVFIKTWFLAVVNRYFRLTPVLALGLWSAIAFWPTIGNGVKFEPASEMANVRKINYL